MKSNDSLSKFLNEHFTFRQENYWKKRSVKTIERFLKRYVSNIDGGWDVKKELASALIKFLEEPK